MEKRILLLLTDRALSIKQLAFILRISESAVRDHISRLKKKQLVLDTIDLRDTRKKYYYSSLKLEFDF